MARALCKAVSLCCAVLLLGGVVRAADPPGEAGHGAGEHKLHHKVLKAHIHGKDGKEYTKVFNVENATERQQLHDHITNGEVGELVAMQAVKPMELRWDLGLWTIVVFLLLFLILKGNAWDPLLKGLQKREDNIHNAL